MTSPAVQPAWADLERELTAWEVAGRVATMWWRDDDAEVPSPALVRLCALADRFHVPLCLAVIPREAQVELARGLASHHQVLLHGWGHRNHAPEGEKAAELGRHRPLDVVLEELDRGRARLRALFGERFVPALVPPWNRIDDAVAAALPSAGLRGLSTFAPRGPMPEGVVQVNTHVDPIRWREGAATMAVADVALRAVEHLRARRLGAVDPEEPTGLLTHHLQHDEAMWRLLPALLRCLTDHPAVRFVGAAGLFAP